MLKSVTFLTVCVALALSSVSAPARACSGLPCPLIELSPASATLPADISAFFVSGGSRLRASLEELPAGGAAQPLTIETVARTAGGTWIVPVAPLEPGKRYRVSAKVPCFDLGDGPPDETAAKPLEFEATAPVALPDSLGATVVTGHGHGKIPVEQNTTCWEAVNVSPRRAQERVSRAAYLRHLSDMNRFFARSLRASLLLGLFAACGDPGGGDEPADPRDDPEVVIGSDTIGKRDGESLRAFEDSISRIECACVSGHSCGKDFTARSSNEALEACWAHSWEVDIATEPAETTECRIGTLEAHRACLLDRAKKCDQQLVDACDNAAGDAFEACGPRGEEAEEALIACEELR